MRTRIGQIFSKNSRFEILLLAVPFILWLYCFRYFYTGQLWLEADAISYSDHINIFTNWLCKGIFTLWQPLMCNGVPNDFFLRRIGNFNPLLLLIVFLKWSHVSSANAYLAYLSVNYFLAGWALFLITRLLLVERFYAFTAYILFLFSSWGSEIFYNYIIIIFVPIIWFFYFLLSFALKPQKGFLLGLCLCLGLIFTTYIPFFFLTIFFIFTFLSVLFYRKRFFVFLKSTLSFVNKHRVFTVFCIFFISASCLPGLMFYKESKSQEFILPNRHAGTDTSSAVAVGLESVVSGDIISHGYFDRLFDDHANIDMGDIYIPYVFFLLLLTSIPGRANKLIFFLMFNILGLSLITITSASGVHNFLYQHILIFRFIRNIYYFFWLGMLPFGILFSVAAFKSLLTSIDNSLHKSAWLVYIIICHVVFILFLFGHRPVLAGEWAGILIILICFIAYFRFKNNLSNPLAFCMILLAVFVQSAQVYASLEEKLFKMQNNSINYVRTHSNHKTMRRELYYSTYWFSVLVNYLDPHIFENYVRKEYILYDNVLPYADSPQFFKTFETSVSSDTNIAFIPKLDSDSGDWKTNSNAPQKADIDPLHSGRLSILSSDPNTCVLKSTLPYKQFLVINNNFNSHWHAFINGHPAKLFRANISFKGLWVPSGESTIMLRYSTPRRYVFHFAMMALFAGTFLYLILLLNKEAKCRQ